MERLTPVEDADRSFDIEFWQRQGDAAIFAAAGRWWSSPTNSGKEMPASLPFKELLRSFNEPQVEVCIVDADKEADP
jgi:hypothetical protein